MSCHDGCMMTKPRPTPTYDEITAQLGFSLEDMNLPPVRPVTKRERHKARTAALRAQAALIGKP